MIILIIIGTFLGCTLHHIVDLRASSVCVPIVITLPLAEGTTKTTIRALFPT